jgi:hypothetical protein
MYSYIIIDNLEQYEKAEEIEIEFINNEKGYCGIYNCLQCFSVNKITKNEPNTTHITRCENCSMLYKYDLK